MFFFGWVPSVQLKLYLVMLMFDCSIQTGEKTRSAHIVAAAAVIFTYVGYFSTSFCTCALQHFQPIDNLQFNCAFVSLSSFCKSNEFYLMKISQMAVRNGTQIAKLRTHIAKSRTREVEKLNK